MPSILNHRYKAVTIEDYLQTQVFDRLPRFQSQIPSYRLCDLGHLPFISVSCVPVGGDDKEGGLCGGLSEMLSQVY